MSDLATKLECIVSTDVTGNYAITSENDNVLRIYKSDRTGATIQMRTFGAITYNNDRIPHRILTTASYVGVNDLQEIIDNFQTILDELKERR